MPTELVPEELLAGTATLERLTTERVDVGDWYGFWRDCDPVVFDHLDLDPDQTPKDVSDRITALETLWDEAESFSYVVRSGDGDELAGYADLQPDWERRTAEVGVVLDHPHWGEWLATETVATLATVAFDRLDLDVVQLTFDAANERASAAARRYADRFGGRVEGPFRGLGSRDGEPVAQRRYTVTAGEFDARDDGE